MLAKTAANATIVCEQHRVMETAKSVGKGRTLSELEHAGNIACKAEGKMKARGGRQVKQPHYDPSQGILRICRVAMRGGVKGPSPCGSVFPHHVNDLGRAVPTAWVCGQSQCQVGDVKLRL